MADNMPPMPPMPPMPSVAGPVFTPEQVEAIGKAFKDAYLAIYSSSREWYKGEATGMKNEVNGIVTGFQAVKLEWTAFKFEPPSIWEIIQNRRAKARGEAPEQLKALGDSAKKRADSAHRLAQSANQNAGTALRRANQVGSGVQQGITARLTPITQSISTLRSQLTQATQRTAAIGRDATAALQGVRRVGTDLNTKSNQLTRRISAVERRQGSGSGGGQDAAALRREGDRTRQAVRDLTNAMRGAGPQSAQFRRQLDQIEQSLR